MALNGTSAPLIEKRLHDCRIHKLALEIWLGKLRKLRWVTIVGSVSLSAIAGASFLTKETLGPKGPLIAAAFAIAASIFSLLHTTLKCDEYQANCTRLIGSYGALEASYEALQLSDESHESESKELEKRYEHLISESAAIAPSHLMKRAKSEVLGA